MPGVLETITFLVISAQAGALGAGLAAVGFSFTGLVGIGLSVGASYLSSLIFKPQQPRPEDVQTSVKNSTAWRQRHYGRVKTSGPWVFADSYAGHFYKVIALGTGELDAIEEFWCDDTLVGIDGDGWATTYPYKPPGYPAFLRIRYRLGLATETYYDELEDIFAEWDNTHRGDGVSSLFITQRPVNAEFISFQFPQLTQTNYRVVARGSKIYDPITATTIWTDNAAAVIRDYMTHADGMGLPLSLFTTTQAAAGWLAAANRAAELVDLKAGGTEARYRLWGTYTFNERPADVLGRMLLSCDGRIIPTADGGITLDIGTWAEPTVTIDTEIIGDFSIKRGRDIRTTANTIAATYMSPNHDYQTIDADRWVDEDDVSLRGEIVRDTSFIMSPSHAQCRRLMKLEAYRAKPNWLGTVQCNLAGLAAFGERFIRLTYTPFDIDEVMEVKDFRFNISDGGILTSVTIEFQSMPEAAYDWDPDTEEGTEPINEETDVDHTIPVPTNFTVTVTRIAVGSILVPFALLEFDNPNNDSLNVEAEGKKTSDTTWRAIPVALDATDATSFALDDGVEYQFRVRYFSATGSVSDWSDIETLTAVADPTAPDALSSVSVTGGNGGATLAYTTPTNLNLAKVVVYRNQTGVFNAADMVHEYPSLIGTAYSKLDGASIANLFTTPDFSATGAWALASMTIGAGVLNKTAGPAGSALQAIAGTVGQKFRFGWNQLTRSAGTFYAYLDAVTDVTSAGTTTTGIKFETLTALDNVTNTGFFATGAAVGTIDDAVVFKETVDCIPAGVTYYWLEAQNASGVAGTRSGPHSVNVF